MVTCKVKSFQNYFSLRRRPSEIIVVQRVETCPKRFHRLIATREYFRFALIVNFRTPLAAEIIFFQFPMWLRVKQNTELFSTKLFQNNLISHVTMALAICTLNEETAKKAAYLQPDSEHTHDKLLRTTAKYMVTSTNLNIHIN